MTNAPKVIAEIGCNHKGDMDIAKELITTAAIFCKADYVKFQKRHNRELLSPEQYAAPHPNPINAYGRTYGEHRENLEFSVDQHKELMDFCGEMKIGYSTSVWDVTSAKQMAALGMTTQDEMEQIVDFFEQRGRAKDLTIYACTSGYPVAFEDVCLLEITRLRERFADRVGSIAFSGHHLGIAADVAALALGVDWIERHFTLDRTWKGTDHAASLEPDGLRRLVRDVRAVSQALSYKKTEILPVEAETRAKLKWEPTERNAVA